MSDTNAKFPRTSAGQTNLLARRVFLVLGLIPLGLSCLLFRTFAPIDGLCPLDIFHLYAVPSPESLTLWRYASGIAVGVLAFLAIFKTPFGIVFFLLEIVSFVVLLIRLAEAMKW